MVRGTLLSVPFLGFRPKYKNSKPMILYMVYNIIAQSLLLSACPPLTGGSSETSKGIKLNIIILRR